MLIDEVVLNVVAGKGGDGAVQFARTMKTNGPTGGDGGRGGNVVLFGVADLGALRVFRSVKRVTSGCGGNGGQNTKTGADGKDKIVRVPVGTVARDMEKGRVYEIMHIGQRIIVAKGGNGGFGNHHFRSSRHTSPDRANPGRPGETATLHIELKLIADIGLIGYPNVGKSSLINELTEASSKVGNYQFTTLEPHLGAHYGVILADIPGLIEGASEGKGLGHKFLRHIERTRVLFHLVSAGSEDPVADYEHIRTELGTYNPALLEKPEWIVVSRADELDAKNVAKIMRILKKKNPNVISCSVLDETSMVGVRRVIADIAREFVSPEISTFD